MTSFFAELKRRNVYKVAVAYAVVAWLLLQLASILFPAFEAPAWVMKAFIALVAAGFPIALVVAWAFELTPEGIKRTDGISSSEEKRAQSLALDLCRPGRRGVLGRLFLLGRHTANQRPIEPRLLMRVNRSRSCRW